MAASAGFSISISAVDKTTATLDRINSKIALAQGAINRRLEVANAPMKRLQTQLNRGRNRHSWWRDSSPALSYSCHVRANDHHRGSKPNGANASVNSWDWHHRWTRS
jgi:hypothetical protein